GFTEQLAVDPGVVGGGGHRTEVRPARLGLHRRARQLPVRHGDAVLGHHPLHHPDVVGADLVAQAAGAGVDHHADLSFAQSEHLRDRRVVDLRYRLHLQEVVAGAEAARLPEPPFHRPGADLGRVGAGHRAAVLAPLQVTRYAVPLLDRVRGTAGEYLVELA